MSSAAIQGERHGATPTTSATRRCIIPASDAERRRLERLVQEGNYVSPMRGLFAPAVEWNRLEKVEQTYRIVRALAVTRPSWVFCLFSAAIIYGLEVGQDQAMPICVRATRRGHTRSSATIRRVAMPSTGHVQVDGAKVTPPAQTVVDCLCELPFPRALAIADSALRVLGLTKEELWYELACRREGPTKAIAAAAISHADARSSNGGESVTRAVMIEEGFMVPDLQLVANDPLEPGNGQRMGYVWDLGDGVRLVGELDEKGKCVLPEMRGDCDVPEVLPDERQRELPDAVEGMRALRFSFADVVNRPKFVRMLELHGVPRSASRIVGM